MSNVNRMAIWYSVNYGRNDGSPLYYFVNLQRLTKERGDLEVMHLSPHGDISQFGKFNYHFWIDWGEDGLPWEEWQIPKDGGKTVYVASDTHITDEGKKYRFEKALQFDYIFFNQLRALTEFTEWSHKIGFNKKAYWLPHAAEPQAYPRYPIIKKYDVAFIGHMQDVKNCNGMNRLDTLDGLFKKYPNFYYGHRHPAFTGKNMFEDAAKRFSESRIVFNISITDDINMRVFEALSTGSFLLTNWTPTLGDLFEDGKHLVTYRTEKEMLEKVAYYLEHENEREKIALAGHREFMDNHTYRNRLLTIFEKLGYIPE